MFFWLHGWGDCGATFQFVVDRLASDWHVVAPDFRGFGNSGSDARSFWFPDYLADLDALLSVYSPDRPARVVGHSMGGNVAGLFAGTLPDRVGAFVNVEGFGLPDQAPAGAPARYRDWIERERGPTRFASYDGFEALAGRIAEDNPRIREDRARFVATCWAREAGARVELRASPRHRLPNPVLYRRAEAEACWSRVKAPVLLVAGADSPFLDRLERAAGGDAADALPFPDRQSTTIAGAGHMIHFDAPSALAAAIEEFLGTLVTPADTV
jgi:pimeloyl-ACP methyl ester carboxylesterase